MRKLLTGILLILCALQAAPSVAAPAGQTSGRAGVPAAVPFEMVPGGASKPAAPSDAAVPAVQAPVPINRPMLPFASILLEGELDARAWAFYLTQDEAESRASIAIGYQNSIVVMPEASRLVVTINGESVADFPISSSEGIRRTNLPLRPGLLRKGENTIRIEAVQRHRTDCSVTATYELWTKIDAATTGLVFTDRKSEIPLGLEDLPSVGLDTDGRTTIHVVASRIHRPEIRDRLLRLVQAVALRGRFAHPVVQVSETDPGRLPAGSIKILMGIASELRGFAADLPTDALSRPLAVMARAPGSRTPALVVSGPDWPDLDAAIALVRGAPPDRSPQDLPGFDTASWHWPSMPTYLGKRSVRFADLGIRTQEFSGRRFTERFAINLPPDFYASAYGEAALHLDAAYTSAVRPGSYVQVIVNGVISATMMIPPRKSVLDRYPVRVTMRNFRPGINHIVFEAVLLTEADAVCAPGENLSDIKRFALFDSSSLDFPDFARIGRSPDLAPVSAGGYPYGTQPATIVMPRPDSAHYAATGTLLARMARDAGEPVRARFSESAPAEDVPVLFVGSIEHLSADQLSRANVSANVPAQWRPALQSSLAASSETEEASANLASAEDFMPGGLNLGRSDAPSPDDVRGRWRQVLESNGILPRFIAGASDWAERILDGSRTSLTWSFGHDPAYDPPFGSRLFMAQSKPDRSGALTIVTARTGDALAEAMAHLTHPLVWPHVSGRAAALDPSGTRLDVQPTRSFDFIRTQPVSLSNSRLVAANWMSINVIPYALLVIVCCTLLGIATRLLLARIGRRSG